MIRYFTPKKKRLPRFNAKATEARLLEHLAIIMDGNGRWATQRGLTRTEGHRKGAEAARHVIESCPQLGIRTLTLYTFSAENWNRPQEEVETLMELFQHTLLEELPNLEENGVRLRFIGNRSTLSEDIQEYILRAEEATKENTTLQLVIALSYGSRQEILQAAYRYAQDVAAGKIPANVPDEATFEHYLDTAGTPMPDLLIRTGGEQRLSNFLLWQCAYTELYFTDILWPDFDRNALEKALADFDRRERRFGTTNSKALLAEAS